MLQNTGSASWLQWLDQPRMSPVDTSAHHSALSMLEAFVPAPHGK